MRLTVLGSSASYPGAGRACAGYLVDSSQAKVLFDCGNGVLSNLGRVVDPQTLDAVFITHCHPDHFVDLFALQALLRYAPEGPADPMPLFLPDGLFDRMKALLSDRGARELDDAFAVTILESGVTIQLGDIAITPVSVKHTTPTFALRAESDGSLLAYTADLSPGPHVTEAMRDADLALCEATLPEEYEGAAPHLTPRQAGEWARNSGVHELLLCHIWPTLDRGVAAAQATEAFQSPVSVVSEFDTYEVLPRRERS